jgi:hypothetical protein
VSNINNPNNITRRSYRPEQRFCPKCRTLLKRSHILWRKRLLGLTGVSEVVSWAYRCPAQTCPGGAQVYASTEAERLHLKHRRYSEVVVQVGYRRFWQHQTIYEVQAWLQTEAGWSISARQVLNLLADFLALLRAAQPAKVEQRLRSLKYLVIGVDGMQPEKGNTCLYVVRELQTGLTLMTENVDDSSHTQLSEQLFEPLKRLAARLDLPWQGVVSDAQESLRLALAQSLPGVPHQTCQVHCLRVAGDWVFQTDRKLKKELKASLRSRLTRLQRRLLTLPAADPYRPVLVDYADTLRAALLVNGIAPFDLAGVKLFDMLQDLALSLTRCQKKGTIACSGDCWIWLTCACPSPHLSPNCAVNANG